MPESTRRTKPSTLRLETLEARLNLSGLSGLSAPSHVFFVPELAVPKTPPAALLSTVVRDVGKLTPARPLVKSLSFGAINVSSTSGTVAIPVDSYTAIYNCRVETQPNLSFPDVGFVTSDGAYVEYSINAANAGTYKLNLGLASIGGSNVRIDINRAYAGAVSAPVTGNWSAFAPVSALVQLPAGASTIRFTVQNSTVYNIAGISLTSVSAPSNVTSISDSTAIPVPTYSGIYNCQLEYQKGLPDIGFVSPPGAYVDYTVNVATAGNYTLTTGSGSCFAASYEVWANGAKLASFTTPPSYSWQTSISQSKSIYLPAGIQTLRFIATNGTQYNLFSLKLDRQITTQQAPASYTSDSTVAEPLILPPVTISSRWMTSFTELDILGTNAGDSINVSQQGSTITVVANGRTTQYTGAFGDIAVWGAGGNDQITIDASVSSNSRLYGGAGNNTLVDRGQGSTTIVSFGGGIDILTGNGFTTNYWSDKSDTLNASSAESSTGHVHLIDSFYQPYGPGSVSNAIDGANLPDPSATGGAWTRLSNNSFWGTGPKQEDINQGGVGDCYYLTVLQSMARLQPDKLQTLAVDLGDGTYAIQFKRNNVTQYVRVDADIPTWSDSGVIVYNHPGNTGNQWVSIMEKAYAFFRSGSNSYASLDFGWMISVYSDFGITANTYGLPIEQLSFYNTVSTALNNSKPVDIVTTPTIVGGAPLVARHAYAVVGVSKDTSGTVFVTLRNPWGYDGFNVDANPADALLTIPYASLKANCGSGSIFA